MISQTTVLNRFPPLERKEMVAVEDGINAHILDRAYSLRKRLICCMLLVELHADPYGMRCAGECHVLPPL